MDSLPLPPACLCCRDRTWNPFAAKGWDNLHHRCHCHCYLRHRRSLDSAFLPRKGDCKKWWTEKASTSLVENAEILFCVSVHSEFCFQGTDGRGHCLSIKLAGGSQSSDRHWRGIGCRRRCGGGGSGCSVLETFIHIGTVCFLGLARRQRQDTKG